MSARSDLLQRRLISFSVAACEYARRLPRDPAGENLARQLARSAMSPVGNYAEARDAESSTDYAHKVKLCVKELRECAAWIEMARLVVRGIPVPESLEKECDELTAILVACLKKVRGASTDERAARSEEGGARGKGEAGRGE